MAETKYPTPAPTSSQSSNAAIPQALDFSVERDALLKEVNDRDNRAYETRTLLDLLQWIELARCALGKVEMVASHYAPVREALNLNGVLYCVPWEQNETDGLCRLIGVIHELNEA